MIFETMNDRGKPLTELELVKNYLLYVSSKLDLAAAHDLNILINANWQHIFESLMAAGLSGRQYEDQLLRTHWLMAYDHDPKRWQSSRTIKANFSLRRYIGRHQELLQDLTVYLGTLRNAATAYCDIHNPERAGAFNDVSNPDLHREVRLWSIKLARLGPRASFLPLLMAVRLKADDGGESYRIAVELCENFDFRVYQWLRYRANAGETQLFRLGNQFFNAPDMIWLKQELARAILDYCPDERFQERFDSETENWYSWGGISYMLYEYEHHLAGGRSVHLTWEAINAREKTNSIEHILPQTPIHPYWQERFTPEQIERWTHDIGNLTLTYDNSSLGNKPFPEKTGKAGETGRYAGSPLFVEHQLAAYEAWTPEQIIDRRKKFQAWVTDRWHVEAPPPRASEQEKSFERIMTVAERNGVGTELEILHEATKKLRLDARVRTRIQYRPPFDFSLSVLTVEIGQGGLYIYFRLHNLAKFPGLGRDRVDELLPYKNHAWSWVPADR